MPTLGSVNVKMCAFLYALLKKSKHQINIVHTARQDISMARNALITDFLKWNDEYLLFLDDDNPPEDIGFLDRLISANKDVVSGLVASRLPDGSGTHRLCIFQEWETPEKGYVNFQYLNIPEGENVFEIATCGMGCVLIKRKVLKSVMDHFPRPCEMKMCTYYWSDEDGEWVRDEIIDPEKIKVWMLKCRRYMSEDILFFERARNLGFKIFARKDVRCTHIGEPEIISIEKHIIQGNKGKSLFKIN